MSFFMSWKIIIEEGVSTFLEAIKDPDLVLHLRLKDFHTHLEIWLLFK